MKKILHIILIFGFNFSFAQQKADRPVAVDDSVTMMQYGTVEINVLANDYDPNGLVIFIEEVDEEDGFEVSFEDSIVSITALEYYDHKYEYFDYKIKNEAGESDRAEILVYFIENPEVPNPVEDFIELECQTELIFDLIDNDEYSGTEELVISEIEYTGNHQIEILDGQQNIKITTGIFSEPFKFGYRIKETAGNEYESKLIVSTVFVRGNDDAPIGVNDNYSVKRGETILLDVLSNDISDATLSIDTTGLPDNVEIVDNQLSFNCSPNVYNSQDLGFQYYAVDENGLMSKLTDVNIGIIDPLRVPVAVDDIYEVDFADTLYFDVLQNDSNFMDSQLVLSDGETIKKIIIGDNNYIRYGWKSFNYQCRNADTNLLSNEATVRYYMRNPNGIELPEVNFHYKIGETLEFNPSDYNNVPDSVELKFGKTLNDLGSLSISDSIMIHYHCKPGKLSEYLNSKDSLYDQIIYTYADFIEGGRIDYIQYFNIIYDNSNTYSFLDVNNFTIPVSPFGTGFNRIHKPQHQFIDAISYDNYSYLLQQIKPWIALEYKESEGLKFSGDAYYANHFFPGPAMDDYSVNYDMKYFRTWQITKAEIDEHIIRYMDDGYQIPDVISDWPSGPLTYNGTVYEQADFVDFNSNQIYDPENGDYPKISGDKAILYIINDNRLYPYNYIADSLNMDIYALVYAFERPESDLFQNTFFIKYKIINKSNIDYQKFRFAQYVENSLYSVKDFIGCDTLLNTFYRFPFSQSNEQFTSTVTLLNDKMGKFLTFGDTDLTDQAMYSNMMGTYGDPFHFWHPPIWRDFAPLDYVFPGRIDDIDSWNNFTHWDGVNSYGVAYGGVTTSESKNFIAGESKYFEFAYSVNYHPEQDYFDFVNIALERAEQLIECYQKDSVPGGGSFTGIKEVSNNSNIEILVYPNPARTLLYVDGATGATEYSIYTLQGQKIEEGRFENEVSIEHLSEGFYILQIRSLDSKREWTGKFVKQ